ncbi:MAG: MerR family transcriptional regulator [Pikeienuella sp.]
MRHDNTAAASRTGAPGRAAERAAPEKSADAFRTISEVAELLDTPAHVLRFWESKFAQIKPMKRGGGRRYYRPEDVALLKGIRELLYEDGLTIKGVQKVLRERGQRHVASLAEPAAEGTAPAAAPETAAAEAQASLPLGTAAPDVGATLARLEALRNRLRQE